MSSVGSLASNIARPFQYEHLPGCTAEKAARNACNSSQLLTAVMSHTIRRLPNITV